MLCESTQRIGNTASATAPQRAKENIMSIGTTIPHTCTARLANLLDSHAAAQPRPAASPLDPSDRLATRLDRVGESRARWAQSCADAVCVAERLRSVAQRRLGRIDRLNADLQSATLCAVAAERLSDSLTEALEQSAQRSVQREAVLHRRVLELRAQLEAPLRAKAEARAAVAAKRKLAKITAACRTVQTAEDLTPQIRTGLRAMVGASNSVPVLIVARGKPKLIGEAGYHVTEGGDVCRYPGAYQRAYGRTHYITSTQEVTVSAAWIRAHAVQIAKAATN